MGVRLVYKTRNGDIETQIIDYLEPDAHVMDYKASQQVEMNDYAAALRDAVHGSGYFGDRYKP